ARKDKTKQGNSSRGKARQNSFMQGYFRECKAEQLQASKSKRMQENSRQGNS
ncbi:hypothetical protein P7K49_010226, partial [Saguinus oedipus]